MRRSVTTGLVLLILGVSACSSGNGSPTVRLDGGDAFDLTVRRGACDGDPFALRCTGTIFNTSQSTQSYSLVVELLDTQGSILETRTVQIVRLEVGLMSDWHTEPSVAGALSSCEVRSVTQYSY